MKHMNLMLKSRLPDISEEQKQAKAFMSKYYISERR